MRWLPILFVLGCDPEPTIEELCAGEGPATIEIGTGAGDAFFPLADGDQVGLVIAPQGGLGVSVRVRTTGLAAEAAVTARLDSELDGVTSATFTNDEVFLFCQDDGTGLFVDQAVGFDPVVYDSLDKQFDLDGKTATLVVEITDARGVTAETTIDVELKVGAR